MNLHQFRFVQEAVRRNLNLTEAAKALHTSQPGVSKAISGASAKEEIGQGSCGTGFFRIDVADGPAPDATLH